MATLLVHTMGGGGIQDGVCYTVIYTVDAYYLFLDMMRCTGYLLSGMRPGYTCFWSKGDQLCYLFLGEGLQIVPFFV